MEKDTIYKEEQREYVKEILQNSEVQKVRKLYIIRALIYISLILAIPAIIAIITIKMKAAQEENMVIMTNLMPFIIASIIIAIIIITITEIIFDSKKKKALKEIIYETFSNRLQVKDIEDNENEDILCYELDNSVERDFYIESAGGSTRDYNKKCNHIIKGYRKFRETNIFLIDRRKYMVHRGRHRTSYYIRVTCFTLQTEYASGKRLFVSNSDYYRNKNYKTEYERIFHDYKYNAEKYDLQDKDKKDEYIELTDEQKSFLENIHKKYNIKFHIIVEDGKLRITVMKVLSNVMKICIKESYDMENCMFELLERFSN